MVGDQADLRRLVRWALEMLEIPFNLHEAGDGRAGLELAGRVAPDLLLVDGAMPGPPGGPEVCRRVRADPRCAATKTVLLCAGSAAGELQAGLGAGADACLAQPVRPLQLVDVVGQLLGPPAPAG